MRSGPAAACDCHSATDLVHMGPSRRRDRLGPSSAVLPGLDEDTVFYERKMPPKGGRWPAPPPFWRTAWVPLHTVHPRGLAGRDAESCSPSFSGLAFAVGLLAGLLIASAAFAGGMWWRHLHRKRRRNRKRLTINPYTGGPHHIITEPAISPPATVANMMSSTTQLVSAAQSQPNSPGFQLPRSSSTRSTAAQSTAQSKLRASRSESSLPLPIVHRDALGKFSTVQQAEFLRDRQSGVASLFSASVADGFRTGAHTSVAYTYTAEPSTATAEHFPRSPVSVPTQSHPSSPHTQTAASGLPFPAPSLRSRALSLESLARTAVARDSVSSVGSTWSSRTRVLNVPPPLPPPSQPLPSIPSAIEAQTTGFSWRSASEEKRLLQLQDALYASQARANSTPSSPTVHSPSHNSTPSAGRTSSLRPLPEAPEDAPAVPQSAREAKSFLSEAPPPPSFHRAPVSPTHFTAESSHGHRDTAPPPAYSRPPSRSS